MYVATEGAGVCLRDARRGVAGGGQSEVETADERPTSRWLSELGRTRPACTSLGASERAASPTHLWTVFRSCAIFVNLCCCTTSFLSEHLTEGTREWRSGDESRAEAVCGRRSDGINGALVGELSGVERAAPS